jgi:hypothetical protein
MHVHVCVYTVHDIHVCTVHAQYILMYMHIMNSVALHIYMMSIHLFLIKKSYLGKCGVS